MLCLLRSQVMIGFLRIFAIVNRRGDACDARNDLEVDGDGVANTADNCPFAPAH